MTYILFKNGRRYHKNTYEIRREESGDKHDGYYRKQHSSENRLYIYKYILNSPGVHLRKICRELGLAMGDTQYQLSILEKEGKIKSKRIGNHRHYYPLAVPDEQNELILAFLRQETIREILIYLMENPGSSQQSLANFMNVSAPTIKWYMSRLVESDLVMATKEGKIVKYFIKDPKSLSSSIKNYMPALWNSLVNKFAEKFFEISLGKAKDSDNRK
jgi:DNA-binding MarR family transcriptional regulator